LYQNTSVTFISGIYLKHHFINPLTQPESHRSCLFFKLTSFQYR